jgi:hypothetical protein
VPRGRPKTPEAEKSQKLIAGLRLPPADAKRVIDLHDSRVKALADEGVNLKLADTLRMLIRRGLEATEQGT